MSGAAARNGSGPGPGFLSSPWRGFLLVFLLHAGIQVFFLTKVPVRYIQPHTRGEVPAASMALYERGDLADPYALPTGPTAHMPPFHPALIAATYHLLGPTLVSGYVIWVLLIATHGVMWGMLPWLGIRLGLAPRAGLLAGIVGALIPRWPDYVEAPAAIAIGLMLAAFLTRWEGGGAPAGRSLALGAAMGLAFHVSPSLLPVPLGLLAWEALCVKPPRWRRGVALVVLGMTLACVPWTIRNYRTFGGLFFIRSNFGLELRMGNHEGAGPTLDHSVRAGTERHPGNRESEARKVRELGELAYMRAAGDEAVAWIRSHPGEFLRLTALRVAQFWFGEVDGGAETAGISLVTILSLAGAWRAFPGLTANRRAAILVPLALYPLVYYVVGFEARYRQPLDGLALLLAASAFFPRPAPPAAPGREAATRP